MEQKKCDCPCHNHNHNHNNNFHSHYHSKKHFHIRKTTLTKTYFTIFFTCLILLIIISIINVIFLIYKIFLPRIFFPGILVYIATFICAGGVLGSYGPINKSEPQFMQMRKCTSIVMVIICLLLSPIFLYQNINFYSSIKDAKLFCLNNNGKSKGDIYSELVDEKEKTFSLRNNFEHKYKNGLTCFENQKCLKSISNSKLFVCNYNYEEKFQNEAKCNKIFETENLVNTFDNANMAYFVSSCLDLKNNKIRPDIELYRCFSTKNLCKEDSITDKDRIDIDNFYEKNSREFDKTIADIQQKLEKFDEDIYFYEEKCYSNGKYIIFYILIFFHVLIHLFVCLIWIILGITNILKLLGYMEDTEMKYYQERIKKINNLYNQYNQVHLSQEKINDIEETTPINVK